MATSYPTSVDSPTDPTANDTMDGAVGGATVEHDVQHTNLNDGLKAVQTALGITGAFNFDAAGAAALRLALTGGTMSGAIAMGSNKITGLTNGSGTQDAAAFGQIPVPGNGYAITGNTGATPTPAVGLSTVSSFITGTQALSGPTNITSASLAAGTWLVAGQCLVNNAGGSTSEFALYLSASSGGAVSTAIIAAETLMTAGAWQMVTFVGIVVVASPATYYLVANNTVPSAVVHNEVQTTSNKVSGFTATRIA